MPKGTLAEAASYIGAQARQLSVLALLVAIGDDNLATIQEGARKSWQKAQSGWGAGSPRYQKLKQAISGQNTPGVLSGGWRAYRCMEAADIVLSEDRRGVGGWQSGHLKFTFGPVDYNAKQRRIRQAYEGRGKIPQKPWRNYPQRAVDLAAIPFDVRHGAAIKRSRAKYIKEAEQDLPLSKARINWQRLSREGRRLGTIRKGRAKIQAALRRAIEDAIQ